MATATAASTVRAIRNSVCPHDCPSACALEVEVLDGARIGTVRGAPDNTYTSGVVCAKVARYRERIHHEERLTEPLLRTGPRGSGQFRPIGWDEALDRIAGTFTDLAARHGPETIWPYFFAGTMGLVQRDGINRLRHVMRYSRQLRSICSQIAETGWIVGAGAWRGTDPREMADSDLIVMWGGNPVATQVNVMTHVTAARKTRGAKFVVIDPYRTGTAAVADMHLPVRPGTDGALACAVMHVAFRDGYADRAYLDKYTDDPAALEAHLRDRDPEWAAAITGLPVEQIEAFARLYCTTQRSYIRLGYGLTRSRNGATGMHAVACVPAVTGAWQHPGGGAFWHARGVYHWDKTLIEGLDAVDSTTRILDMSRIGAVLTGDPSALADGGPVRALLVQSTNPMAVAPDLNRVHRGFARDDLFTVVHEQFMTETARMADIVLPATMFMEHDDLYYGGAHGFIQVGPKLVEPPGQCRSNHDVLCALAHRLGARHPGFEMTAYEMADATLRASGWPSADEVVAAKWIDAQPDFRACHFLDGFGHADKRFHFKADWSVFGGRHASMPQLPDYFAVTDERTDALPFRLVAAPARQFLNTSFTEIAAGRRREGRPTALLHPDDAARLGVVAGGRVRLGNNLGEVVVHAAIAEGQLPGVVVVESIWPNDAFEGGIGINALISDEPAYPAGGAVFHDTAVWMEAVAAEAALPVAAE